MAPGVCWGHASTVLMCATSSSFLRPKNMLTEFTRTSNHTHTVQQPNKAYSFMIFSVVNLTGHFISAMFCHFYFVVQH